MHCVLLVCITCMPLSLLGIGRATVKALAQSGAEVIALTRTESDLDSLKQEVHRVLLFILMPTFLK